jgi:hypothetical protein
MVMFDDLKLPHIEIAKRARLEISEAQKLPASDPTRDARIRIAQTVLERAESTIAEIMAAEIETNNMLKGQY